MIGSTNVGSGAGGSDAGVYIINGVTKSNAETLWGQADGLMLEKERNVQTLNDAGIIAGVDEPTDALSQKMVGLTNVLSDLPKEYVPAMAMQDIPKGWVLAQNNGGWTDQIFTNVQWNGTSCTVARSPSGKHLLITNFGELGPLSAVLLDKQGVNLYTKGKFCTNFPSASNSWNAVNGYFLSDNQVRIIYANQNSLLFSIAYDADSRSTLTYISGSGGYQQWTLLYNVREEVRWQDTAVISTHLVSGSTHYNMIALMHGTSTAAANAWAQISNGDTDAPGVFTPLPMVAYFTQAPICRGAQLDRWSAPTIVRIFECDLSVATLASAIIVNRTYSLAQLALGGIISYIWGITLTPGAQYMYLLGNNNILYLYDIQNLDSVQKIAQVTTSSGYITINGSYQLQLRISPDQRFFAFAYQTGYSGVNLRLVIFERDSSAIGYNFSQPVYNYTSTVPVQGIAGGAYPANITFDVIEDVGYELYISNTSGMYGALAAFRYTFDSNQWEAVGFSGDLSETNTVMPKATRLGLNAGETIPAGTSFDLMTIGDFA